MSSFGVSVKVEAPLLVTMVVIQLGGGVVGLQAGNFAGITINRHFRGDIFHNEGETPFYILEAAIDVVLELSSASSHHQLVKRILCEKKFFLWLIHISYHQ